MADVSAGHANRARRRGRTIAIVVYGIMMTAFTAVCSIEIILQAWEQPPVGSSAGPGALDCRSLGDAERQRLRHAAEGGDVAALRAKILAAERCLGTLRESR